MGRLRPFPAAVRPVVWAIIALLLAVTVHHPTTGFALDSAMVADWIGQNEQQGAEYGFAVAAAGDVNGDNYDDVVIGAPRHDDGAYRAGIALVYAGSPLGLPAESTWAILGEQTGERLGAAVAGGDINADGYADIVVGAPRCNESLPEAGRVQIHHGSPAGPSAGADWIGNGPQANCRMGESVAIAGDVNRDGYDDVIMGAPWCESGDDQIGQALFFLGGAGGMGEQPDTWLISASPADGFGSAVAAAGDVNGDGYGDVLVGAPYFAVSEVEVGAAYLFLGAPSGLQATSSWVFIGNSESALLGAALAGLGDINDDGFDDIMVGAPGEDEDAGAAYVFLGSFTGPGALPGNRIMGRQPAARFGAAISSAGDVNGDGFADAFVGAPFHTEDQDREGAAFLYFGAPSGWLSAGAIATGDKAETAFGASLAHAGDVNRDQYPDLIVGAPTFRQASIIVGRAFAYHGPVESSATNLLFLPLMSGGSSS